MTRTILTGATVIDGTGAAPLDVDVAIEGERIVEVGSGLRGDDVVDLTGRWLLPGLIDAHVHVMVDDFSTEELLTSPFSLAFFRAACNLERTLAAGITTVRDAGGADLGVKVAAERGLVNGSRVSLSINLLSPTGGHADHWSTAGLELPDLVEHPGRPAGVCDGVDQVTRVTRMMLRAGADFIKLCATGGVLSPNDTPSHPGLSSAEMRAAVEVAEQHGTYVAAHAHGSAGLKAALRVGVRTIEHGSILDDEAVELMVASGAFLVPTLSAARWIRQSARYGPEQRQQADDLVDAQRRSVKLARAGGVPIAMGTDAGVAPHGANLAELHHLVDCGLSPLEAISSATGVAAAAIMRDDDLGTIRPGRFADLVVLREDPLVHLDRLTDGSAVVSVWLAGRVVAPRGLV